MNSKEKNYKCVSEGLAEWAELNYFRRDTEIFQIIRQHARYQKYPHWPYAAAWLIENNDIMVSYKDFRNLVTLFRMNVEQTYQYLNNIQ